MCRQRAKFRTPEIPNDASSPNLELAEFLTSSTYHLTKAHRFRDSIETHSLGVGCSCHLCAVPGSDVRLIFIRFANCASFAITAYLIVPPEHRAFAIALLLLLFPFICPKIIADFVLEPLFEALDSCIAGFWKQASGVCAAVEDCARQALSLL